MKISIEKMAFGFCMMGLMVACQKPTNDVDLAGSCTSSYINAYNTMVQSNNAYVNTKTKWQQDETDISNLNSFLSQMRQTNSDCQSFQADHAGVHCQADTGTIQTNDFQKTCNDAQEFFDISKKAEKKNGN